MSTVSLMTSLLAEDCSRGFLLPQHRTLGRRLLADASVVRQDTSVIRSLSTCHRDNALAVRAVVHRRVKYNSHVTSARALAFRRAFRAPTEPFVKFTCHHPSSAKFFSHMDFSARRSVLERYDKHFRPRLLPGVGLGKEDEEEQCCNFLISYNKLQSRLKAEFNYRDLVKTSRTSAAYFSYIN